MAEENRPTPHIAPEVRPAVFVEGSLFRHIMVMSATASVGLMAVFVVDLINMIYISWLGRSELAAAIGYAGAVLFFTSSMGIGMSIAVSALVSRALGARDRAGAVEKATTGMVMGLIFGSLFALIVFFFIPPIAAALGATGATHELTVHYLQILIPSQPLLMVGMVGGAVLRAHGDARAAMMSTVWGAVTTAVLDPILIFVFNLDLTGAAIASVISRLVMGWFAVRPILKHYGGFNRPNLADLKRDMGPVWQIGLPAILTQVATPVGMAFVTRAAATHGEAAVAGMAIVGRLVPVAFCVIFAMSGALGPIIGQNIGAGRMERVRQSFWQAILFASVLTVVVSAVLYLLRSPLADLFNATGETRDVVYLFCGPIALMWVFNAFIFIGNAFCNNLGRPFWSTLANWGRQTLGTMPFAVWLGALYGAEGVLFGQALGGVPFAFLALLFGYLAIRNPNLPARGPMPKPAPISQPEAQENPVPGERRA